MDSREPTPLAGNPFDAKPAARAVPVVQCAYEAIVILCSAANYRVASVRAYFVKSGREIGIFFSNQGDFSMILR